MEGEVGLNLRRAIGGAVLAILASTVVFAVLAVLGDGPSVAAALGSFPPGTLAMMLLLGLGCFVVRAIRWGWLMARAGHPVGARDALYMHIAGQTMAVSPGRLGEVLKPWLAREIARMPMARGIALVFCERVADLLAVCVLTLGGLSLIGARWWAGPLVIGVMAAGVWVAGSTWFHRIALAVLAKQSWAAKHAESATAMSQTVRDALAWRPLARSALASTFAWGLEGLGFYLCVRALGFDGLGVFSGISAYAAPTIVGAFTFLPGGIGGTEASMAGILVAVGMPAATAAAATVVARVATLWWAVALGWIVLASRPALLRRLFSTIVGTDGDAEEPGTG